MGIPKEIILLCIISVVWSQQVCSEGISTKSVTSNWTCTCSIARQANLNFVPVNCSSSCICTPAEKGSNKNKWACICPVDGLPKVVGQNKDGSCFTTCNCNAGALTELQTPNKRIFSKSVLIVLLLFGILMVLSFVASLFWYAHPKGKRPIKWPSFSTNQLTSFISASTLISHTASSISADKGSLDSSFKRKMYIGCIPANSFRFRSRTGGTVHGTIIQFSYSELESATNKFSDSNLIGFGGSSDVYHGNLKNGRTVAIKKMKTQHGLDAEIVFLAEIELIARLHHCHVVSLLGYCSEYQGKNVERLLVFEYIPNGNLRECLDGDLRQCLDWNTRIAIALGAARGLEYLHDAAAPRILHRDVKSTNILLDENWRAKITDLGMATHLHSDGVLSCSSSPARMQGTFGYFAPEYAIIGRASLKSDVFSFGVVLLELITGRKPIQKLSNKVEESLVLWATPRLHDSKRVILELPDQRLKENFQEEEMQVMAYLAKKCLLLDPDSRPSMSEVVQILSTIAPDRSRRKNMPENSFLYSGTSGLRSMNPECCNEELSETTSTEEIKQIAYETPAGRCLLPANPGIDFYAIKSEIEPNSSPNDIERLMLLTTKSRSWRVQDHDEIVDLTEPRMESFCLPNVDSHIVEIT